MRYHQQENNKKLYAFSTFDRQCSLFIKGIAIILMICHHMWWFRDVNDFSGVWYYLAPYLIALGKAGKVCVAIFTFISGYGLYLSFIRNNKYAKTLKKVKDIIFHFWRTVIPILIVFFIVGIIPFDITTFLQNMLCLDNSYNGAWWYLQTYLLYLAISPIIFNLIQNRIALVTLCVLSMTLFRYIAYLFLGGEMCIHYFFYYFPFFVLGSVFAKYNLLEKMSLRNRSYLSFFLYLLITLICLIIRLKTGYSEILFILVPCFILMFVQRPIPNSIFVQFFIFAGKYSMGIWLLHAFFIKQVPLQLITNNCLLHFILIFSVSLLISYVIEKINHVIYNKKSVC